MVGCVLSQMVAQADTYLFYNNRFGGMDVKVESGKGYVRFYQGSKQGEEDTFKSTLVRVKENVYKTPKGVIFTLKKLAKPVVNDANRGQNSGDWQLQISGDKEALKALKPKIPFVAFGAKGDSSYYGTKSK